MPAIFPLYAQGFSSEPEQADWNWVNLTFKLIKTLLRLLVMWLRCVLELLHIYLILFCLLI